MGRFWKKALIGLAVAACILAGLWYAGLRIVDQRDEAALEDIKRIKQALQAEHARTGTYPQRINDILSSFNTGSDNIMFVIPRPEIRYFAMPNGYRLQYYHWPMGPFLGYDSRTDDWYCEE